MAMCVNLSYRLVYPKIMLINNGETVVVSHILRNHRLASKAKAAQNGSNDFLDASQSSAYMNQLSGKFGPSPPDESKPKIVVNTSRRRRSSYKKDYTPDPSLCSVSELHEGLEEDGQPTKRSSFASLSDSRLEQPIHGTVAVQLSPISSSSASRSRRPSGNKIIEWSGEVRSRPPSESFDPYCPSDTSDTSETEAAAAAAAAAAMMTPTNATIADTTGPLQDRPSSDTKAKRNFWQRTPPPPLWRVQRHPQQQDNQERDRNTKPILPFLSSISSHSLSRQSSADARMMNSRNTEDSPSSDATPLVIQEGLAPPSQICYGISVHTQLMGRINNRILSGLEVPLEDWVELRSAFSEMNEMFGHHVKYEWEARKRMKKRSTKDY